MWTSTCLHATGRKVLARQTIDHENDREPICYINLDSFLQKKKYQRSRKCYAVIEFFFEQLLLACYGERKISLRKSIVK